MKTTKKLQVFDSTEIRDIESLHIDSKSLANMNNRLFGNDACKDVTSEMDMPINQLAQSKLKNPIQEPMNELYMNPGSAESFASDCVDFLNAENSTVSNDSMIKHNGNVEQEFVANQENVPMTIMVNTYESEMAAIQQNNMIPFSPMDSIDDVEVERVKTNINGIIEKIKILNEYGSPSVGEMQSSPQQKMESERVNKFDATKKPITNSVTKTASDVNKSTTAATIDAKKQAPAKRRKIMVAPAQKVPRYDFITDTGETVLVKKKRTKEPASSSSSESDSEIVLEKSKNALKQLKNTGASKKRPPPSNVSRRSKKPKLTDEEKLQQKLEMYDKKEADTRANISSIEAMLETKDKTSDEYKEIKKHLVLAKRRLAHVLKKRKEATDQTKNGSDVDSDDDDDGNDDTFKPKPKTLNDKSNVSPASDTQKRSVTLPEKSEPSTLFSLRKDQTKGVTTNAKDGGDTRSKILDIKNQIEGLRLLPQTVDVNLKLKNLQKQLVRWEDKLLLESAAQYAPSEETSTQKMKRANKPRKPKSTRMAWFAVSTVFNQFGCKFINPTHVLKAGHFATLEYLFADPQRVKDACTLPQYPGRIKTICKMLTKYDALYYTIKNECDNILQYSEDRTTHPICPSKRVQYKFVPFLIALRDAAKRSENDNPIMVRNSRKTKKQCQCFENNLYLAISLFIVTNLKAIFTEVDVQKINSISPVEKLRLFQKSINFSMFTNTECKYFDVSSDGKIQLQQYYEKLANDIPKLQFDDILFYCCYAIMDKLVPFNELITICANDVRRVNEYLQVKSELDVLIKNRANYPKEIRTAIKQAKQAQDAQKMIDEQAKLKKLLTSQAYFDMSAKIAEKKMFLQTFSTYELLIKIIYLGNNYPEVSKIVPFLQHQFLHTVSKYVGQSGTWLEFITPLLENSGNIEDGIENCILRACRVINTCFPCCSDSTRQTSVRDIAMSFPWVQVTRETEDETDSSDDDSDESGSDDSNTDGD